MVDVKRPLFFKNRTPIIIQTCSSKQLTLLCICLQIVPKTIASTQQVRQAYWQDIWVNGIHFIGLIKQTRNSLLSGSMSTGLSTTAHFVV